MNELQQITEAFKAAQERGEAVALASVVAVADRADTLKVQRYVEVLAGQERG